MDSRGNVCVCVCVFADHLLTFFSSSVQLGLHKWNIFRDAGADDWTADDDDGDGGGGGGGNGTQKIKSRKLKALRLQSQYLINIAEGGFEHLGLSPWAMVFITNPSIFLELFQLDMFFFLYKSTKIED